MKRESYFTEEEQDLDIYKRAFKEGFDQGLDEVRQEHREEARRNLVQAALLILRKRELKPSIELEVALGEVCDWDRLIAIVGRAAVVESADQLLGELREADA